MNVRYGETGDFEWLRENEKEVSSEWMRRCLGYREYLVALERSRKQGFLRFSLFWGIVPYIDMIQVLENHRRRGVGTALFDFWEQEMKKRGARMLMTSAAANECEPQTWHRRNGFWECGRLTLRPHQTAPEVFFVKDLSDS